MRSVQGLVLAVFLGISMAPPAQAWVGGNCVNCKHRSLIIFQYPPQPDCMSPGAGPGPWGRGGAIWYGYGAARAIDAGHPVSAPERGAGTDTGTQTPAPEEAPKPTPDVLPFPRPAR